MADRGALRRPIQLRGAGSGDLRGLWDRGPQLNSGRRPREPLSPPKASPRVLFARFSTTSDVVAAPREMDGARKIEHGSKLDAESHGTVLNESPRISTFLALMPTHRRRASTWHERCRRTRCQVDSARGWPSSRLNVGRLSLATHTASMTVRVSDGVHLLWRSNDVRTSCVNGAKRPREKTSSRERLQRPSTTVQLLEPTQKVAQTPRPPLSS